MNEVRKIRDVCSRFSSGKNISANKVHEVGMYPVYGGNGLRGYTDQYNFDGECAIIGRQGAYCGNVKYFSGKGYMTEHAIVAVANSDNNTRFLSYKFDHMNLGRYAGQSAQPGLSVETLLDIDIDVPKKNEQLCIAKALSMIDVKIANNSEICSDLESMAKFLYDYWFVQFDFPDENGRPYKSSGGKMVWNEELKREIPEGWEVKRLREVATYVSDKVASALLTKNTYVGTDNLLSDMKGKTVSEYVPVEGYSTAYKEKDILIANIRPYFKKIWQSDSIGGASADVLVIRTKKEIDSWVYSTLARDDFFAYDMAGSKGSKMPRGDKDHIMNYPIPYSEQIIKQFSFKTSYVNELRNYYYHENQQLASLRDFLLPMLMNGQVKVGKAGE